MRIATPAISLLVELEFASAVARKVRTRKLTVEGAREALGDFHADRAAGRYRLAGLHESHYIQARHWIETLRTPLRTLDAIHLAVARGASLPLLTADRQLADAAKTLGFKSRHISA